MITDTDILIVGAGPAGLLAAIRAARLGARVIVAEKNKLTGRKLRLCGKGRCNITNIAEKQSFIRQYGPQGKFLHSAFSRFFQREIIALLEDAGVPTKEERGGRVFPVSDRADDVADALERVARDAGARIMTGCKVEGLIISQGGRAEDALQGTLERTSKSASKRELKGALDGTLKDAIKGALVYDAWDRSEIRAKAVIIATGGLSYPLTGSTGDGYGWAREAGHTIIDLKPGLVPLESPDKWVRELSGLTLKNVKATLWEATDAPNDAGNITDAGVSNDAGNITDAGVPNDAGNITDTGVPNDAGNITDAGAPNDAGALINDGASGGENVSSARRDRRIASYQGETLFAHFGLTGPIILSLSRHYREDPGKTAYVTIDLKPALSFEILDKRLQRDFLTYQKKNLSNAMVDLLPKALINPLLEQCGLDPRAPVSELTRAQRLEICRVLKALKVNITGARPLDEAIVTAGGVSLAEVEPKTMASRLVPGLYFAGELLDIDGSTGGYNLQIAFSTGALAGESAASDNH